MGIAPTGLNGHRTGSTGFPYHVLSLPPPYIWASPSGSCYESTAEREEPKTVSTQKGNCEGDDLKATEELVLDPSEQNISHPFWGARCGLLIR